MNRIFIIMKKYSNMRTVIYNRSQVSVYRTIGPLVCVTWSIVNLVPALLV